MPQIIDVPGRGQVEFPDGMSDADITSAIKKNMPKTAAPKAPQGNILDRLDQRMYEMTGGRVGKQYQAGMSEMDKWKDAGANVGSAIARPAAQAVAAMPLAAMDFGVAARNTLQGALTPKPQQNLSDLVLDKKPQGFQPYELPSSMFTKALNSVTRAPQDTKGKVAEALTSMVMGSALPGPTLNAGPPKVGAAIPEKTYQFQNQAPSNFVANPQTPKDATFIAGRELGLSAPPASVNPSLANRMGETLGGKVATAQDASIQNMPIFTGVAKRTLGMADDADMSLQGLKAVRDSAQPAYDAIRGAGVITSTDKFKSALQSAIAPFKNAAKDFKTVDKPELTALVDDLSKESFDASSAVDAIKIIRESSGKAYQAGDKSVGAAYKSIANALEDVIEENLSKSGEAGADVLKNFRAARELIAKSYSVEKALNPATGVVSGTKLAQQLARGKPLSGELRQAAEFAQAFPKASREILDSGAVRNTDLIVGGGTAAISGQPWYLGYPLLRSAARSLLLSKGKQDAVLKAGGNGLPPSVINALLPLTLQRQPQQ